jgi:3'-5' exoribonuclease
MAAAAPPLADLVEGGTVEGALLCRRVERLIAKTGRPYLRLELADRSGSLRAYLFDPSPDQEQAARTGAVVWVRGRYANPPEYGPQLKLERLAEAPPGSYDPDLLHRQPPAQLGELERRFWALVDSLTNPDLKRLVSTVLDPEGEAWRTFREVPAAKQNHQPYRHGLLEHTVEVAEGVAALAQRFGGVNRDLAVAGALLHDIGKVDSYRLVEGVADLTDLGRLHGEIPLGYFRVRSGIEALEGFPKEVGDGLLHIILSHHGTLEHGSPVLPATKEALLVHAVDNISAKLGTIDRLLDEHPPGTVWSNFDRALGTSAYLGAAQPAGEAAPADQKPLK